MSERELSMADRKRISDALLKIRALQDRQLRDLYLTELEVQLGHSVVVHRYSDAIHDVWSLVSALQAYPRALHLFAQIVRTFHGESAAIIELEDLLKDLLPTRLLNDHQTALDRLLSQIPETKVEAAFRYAFTFDTHETAALPREPRIAAGRIDLTVRRGEFPAALFFADFLAHDAGGAVGLDLHRWIDSVGVLLGLNSQDLRNVCVETMNNTSNDAATAAMGVSIIRGLEQDSSSRSDIEKIHGEIVIPAPVATSAIIDRPDTRLIWGGVPMRNPEFTGRENCMTDLRAALLRGSKASVLPQALHGLGGVGKTQLAVEYVYRFANQYDLVWWISAEQGQLIRSSLATLGGRLGLPPSDDMQQTATTVLDSLGASPLRWLLVYDNADQPEELASLLPSAGGHVIITSRNQAWATARIGQAIEVDVFQRTESVELLCRRGEGITPEEADLLAEKLGDLPLALEQAAIWQAATGMPVVEYLELFDANIEELLSEGKPVTYPTTVYAFLRVAFDRLRAESPAAAQLLELFAFLGAEPLSKSLLRRGRLSDQDSPLALVLRDSISMGRAMRELQRYGVAKLDPGGQRIQVHRLVQLVLRDGLRTDRREKAMTAVQELIASANPGEPDELTYWPVYADIGPHLDAAQLVDSPSFEARQVVLDYARYLFRIGDYESSRKRAEQAFTSWSESTELGPDHVQTLVASGRLANACRLLGSSRRARELDENALDRMRRHPDLGEDHEYTLQAADRLAVDLRVAGEFLKAREIDEDNLSRHLRVYGDSDQHTLFMRNNVAVSLRMLGEFAAAYEIDAAVAGQWRETLGTSDVRTLFSLGNLARDLYGLGRYAEALETQQQALPLFAQQLNPGHNDVMLCHRTVAISLRKLGQYTEAVRQARDNYRTYHSRFGADHEHTLAATMSYANALRVNGELAQAESLAADAIKRYEHQFGDLHPLSLSARVNLAIILRLRGEQHGAKELSNRTYEAMKKVLGPRHPYTLCAATTYANDLAQTQDLNKAQKLSRQIWELSQDVRGPSHPYTVACSINSALDMQAVDNTDEAQIQFDQSTSMLAELLGASHPEVIDARRGKRVECDIEPPPT